MRPVFALLALGLLVPPAAGDLDPAIPIDRVEEDWELVVRSTDVLAAGPQITTTMCPGPVEDHPDVNFNLNYRELEAFSAGGLQIQVFDGRDHIAVASSRTEVLQTDNEKITWTQRLSLAGGSVAYEVRAGHSTTWGDFGGEDLSVSFASDLADLRGYKPEISRSKSAVSWQSDHVASMRLLEVRYFVGGNLVSTDSSPRTVIPAKTP